MMNFGNPAGELLLYFSGVVCRNLRSLFYCISIFGRKSSIQSEVEVWYAVQVSDTTMLNVDYMLVTK